jgi:hypothetical protein
MLQNLGYDANYFLNHLWLGYTVKAGMDLANVEYPPLVAHFPFDKLPMGLDGRSSATLRFVYLTSVERTALSLGPQDLYDYWY